MNITKEQTLILVRLTHDLVNYADGFSAHKISTRRETFEALEGLLEQLRFQNDGNLTELLYETQES